MSTLAAVAGAGLAPGEVRVRVPATSANLGPGYDCLGLALDLCDVVTGRRTDGGLAITIDGVGADSVPRDGNHLVVRAAARAFAALGEPMPGLALHCVNEIPHGSGQGSSAAAIVAGILLARGLTDDGEARLSDDDVFDLATEMEGHPDNVAPSLWGGFTISWMAGSDPSAQRRSGAAPRGRARAVRLAPHPELQAVVWTAEEFCATDTARAALPTLVTHARAAANSARAALLVHAMTAAPHLLWDATEDGLHQEYRAAVMPRTAELLDRLRSQGIAAVLSGAGPSVLALGVGLPPITLLAADGFDVRCVEPAQTGAVVQTARG